jgi:hypothetical protein
VLALQLRVERVGLVARDVGALGQIATSVFLLVVRSIGKALAKRR